MAEVVRRAASESPHLRRPTLRATPSTVLQGGQEHDPGGQQVRARRLPPQDLRCRHRSQGDRFDLDVGARLVSVDLQERVTDAQRHAIIVGKNDLDMVHVGHLRSH
jgi:hypothetical protein